MEGAVEAVAVGGAAAVGGDGDRVGGPGRFWRGCGLGAAPLAERGEVDGALPVDDFGGDGDFGGFDGAEEVFARLEGLGVVVAGAEVFELLVLLVDFAAGADVDEESDEDHDPGCVVSFVAPVWLRGWSVRLTRQARRRWQCGKYPIAARSNTTASRFRTYAPFLASR